MRHVSILLVVLLSAKLVSAEEVTSKLDEIVVTASRVGEKLSDTPVSISVISEKEIEQVKYRNPDEILRRIPGIYSHDFGGESELTSIRIPTHFTNPYTLFLIDGVPTSSYGSGSSGNFVELNSDNIARVEVVRGPSSAIYGSNAIGGVINVITKNPTSRPMVKGWTELGEDNQWRSGLSGSGSSDKMGYNFGLNNINSDNWREHSQVDKTAANAKLQYIPTEQGLLTFKLDYIYFDNESSGTLNKDDFKDNWKHSYQTFAYKKYQKISPLLSYTHYLGSGELKTTFVYRDIDEKSIPNYSIRKQGPVNYVGQYSKSDINDFDGQLIYNRELDLLSSRIIVGVDAERGKTDSQQYNLDVTYDSAVNKYTGYTNVGIDDDFDITTKMYAPYLQVELSPIENLKLTAGGRYDSVNYDVDSKVDASKSGDKDFSRFSPKFGAVYQFSPNLNTYLNISEGFVVPTTSQLLTSSWANIDLDPETATNYEVGLRSLLLDRQIDLGVALYTMDIKDKIVASDISRYVKKYENAGETSQKGLEVMASYSPVDFASLSLAYTYAKNKFKEYSPGAEDYDGNYLPRSPKHRLNLRLNVRPIAGLDVELEMDKISKQYSNDANTADYSRPALFNLRAKYDWQRWSFWTSLENLTNKEYASYVSYSESDATTTLYSGKPRTFFAGISYTWQGDE